ncbi:MAG: PAS domain S-box protein [Chloroflexi bacterium]|nr:PAS domain S-box protein [Chloroflexota bacterium]MBT7289242.1 PAS domain S-box protein [Chloroflexota bacterium]
MEKPDNTKEQFIQVIDTLRDSLAEMERLQAERTKAVDEALRLSKFPSENPNPVLRIAKNGTVIYANDASASLLAYWGCKVNDKLPLDWRKKIIAAIKANAPVTVDVEYQDVVLSLTLAPVSDLAQVNIYGLDITERKRAEESLRESDEILNKAESIGKTGSWKLDPKTFTVTWSKELYRIFGLNPDEDQNLLEAGTKQIHPDDKVQAWNDSAEAVEEKRPYEIGYRIVRPDGTQRYVINRGEPVFDDNGDLESYVGAVLDVTERTRAEEALKESEQEHKSILGSISDGFFTLDNNMVVTSFNSAAEILLGKKQEDVLGKNLFESFPEAKGSVFEENYSLAIREKKHIVFEIYFNVPPYINWYDVRVYPYEDGISVYFQITTERKKAEEDLKASETKFRGLYESIGMGTALCEVITDKKGKAVNYRFLDINEKYTDMTGITREMAIGKTATQIAPNIEQHWIDTLGAVAITGKSTYFENYYATSDQHFSLYAYSPAMNQFACLVQDITERRRAEQEISRLAKFPSENPNPVLRIDKDGTVIYANDASGILLDTWGYSNTKCVPERTREIITEVLQSGVKSDVEVDCDSSILALTFAPVSDLDQVNVYGLDITERRRAEQQREKLLTQLESKTKELEQIIYVSSHDLRSPLVNIRGFAGELENSLNGVRRILNETGIPSVVRESFNTVVDNDISGSIKYINSSVYKMDSLLSGLLKLSRLGRAAMHLIRIDMNDLISLVTQSFEYKIKEYGITLELEDLLLCYGDRVQINQVFSNLIDNAIKFRDPNRSAIIRISSSQSGEHIVYCVEDNGVGIMPEYQTKIFEIFHQLNPKQSEGDGLGLTIVQRIVDRHGGRVWLEPAIDQGSKFCVSLPANKSTKRGVKNG